MKRRPAKPKKPISHPVKTWNYNQYRRLLKGEPWEYIDRTPEGK